jgi:hypothetical protein
MNWRMYFLLVALGGAAIAFWLPKPAQPSALAAAASGSWQVPEPRFLAPTPTTVKPVAVAPELWGQFVSSAPAVADTAPKTWRLVGVALQPKDSFVLVSFDGKDPEARKIGDVLPGGSKVASIAQDHICVFIDGDVRKRRKLMLREEQQRLPD